MSNWYKEQFKKAAEKKKLTGSAISKKYKAVVSGLNYGVLQKQRKDLGKYKDNFSAFQPAAPKPGSYNETIKIKSYTGDIKITVQLPQSPEPDGSYGYVNIINVEKVDNGREDIKPLTDRQIKNRMLKVAEKVVSTFRSNNYYVNGDQVSEIELIGDLVGELTIAYKEEIR